MSATELQALLRFLSQDAKVPLAIAMGKVKELQTANLDSAEKLSKAKADDIKNMFEDEKVRKQIISAAKRVTKKRAAGSDDVVQPSKKQKKDVKLFSDDATLTSEELEASLELPKSTADEEELSKTVVFTNRAPLALAFVFTLLGYTMPAQPLSSRLSLAQGYISITSRARAVSLGIESGKSADEEGYGEGTPSIFVTGKEIHVLRRWGYEWKGQNAQNRGKDVEAAITDENATTVATHGEEQHEADEQPALWALDLEALKKSSNHDPIVASGPSSRTSNSSSLPIYTPQSARSYLVRAFAPPPNETGEGGKKLSAAANSAAKERNLGMLLRALDLLYESWAAVLTAEELDKRTWGWYVKVRPDVADGVAGWGGKNILKLADILALRRSE